jgi:hypothetical protein
MSAAAPSTPLKPPLGGGVVKLFGVGLVLYGVASIAASLLGFAYTLVEYNYPELIGPLWYTLQVYVDLIGLVAYGIASCFVVVVGLRALSGRPLGLAPLMVGVLMIADAAAIGVNPGYFVLPQTISAGVEAAAAIVLGASSLIIFEKGQRKARAVSMLLAMLALGLFYYGYLENEILSLGFPAILGSFSQFYFNAFWFSVEPIQYWAGGSFIETFSAAAVGSTLVFFAAEGALALGALTSLAGAERMEGAASTWRDLALGGVSFFFGLGVSLIGANLLYGLSLPLGYVWFAVPSQAQGGFQLQVASLVACIAIVAVLVASGMAFMVSATRVFSSGEHPLPGQALVQESGLHPPGPPESFLDSGPARAWVAHREAFLPSAPKLPF